MTILKSKLLVLITCILLISNCATLMPFEAAVKYDLPAITLPVAPERPAIKSTVIVYENTQYVAYTVPDSLELYKYLLRKDAYEEKLIFRINEMNELLRKIR